TFYLDHPFGDHLALRFVERPQPVVVGAVVSFFGGMAGMARARPSLRRETRGHWFPLASYQRPCIDVWFSTRNRVVTPPPPIAEASGRSRSTLSDAASGRWRMRP